MKDNQTTKCCYTKFKGYKLVKSTFLQQKISNLRGLLRLIYTCEWNKGKQKVYRGNRRLI